MSHSLLSSSGSSLNSWLTLVKFSKPQIRIGKGQVRIKGRSDDVTLGSKNKNMLHFLKLCLNSISGLILSHFGKNKFG